MKAHIRAAEEADLERLVEHYSQLSLDQTREDAAQIERYRAAFREIERSSFQHILVADIGEAGIVGSVTLLIVPNLTYTARPFAIIENVIVDTAARGAGVGEALISRAVEIAREAGCYRVSLTSNKRRSEAHKFYERLGFKASHDGFQLRF
jgi:GNAT superfamily N-acetyltransferase